jgi:hypothetical protein
MIICKIKIYLGIYLISLPLIKLHNAKLYEVVLRRQIHQFKVLPWRCCDIIRHKGGALFCGQKWTGTRGATQQHTGELDLEQRFKLDWGRKQEAIHCITSKPSAWHWQSIPTSWDPQQWWEPPQDQPVFAVVEAKHNWWDKARLCWS